MCLMNGSAVLFLHLVIRAVLIIPLPSSRQSVKRADLYLHRKAREGSRINCNMCYLVHFFVISLLWTSPAPVLNMSQYVRVQAVLSFHYGSASPIPPSLLMASQLTCSILFYLHFTSFPSCLLTFVSWPDILSLEVPPLPLSLFFVDPRQMPN